MNQKIVVIDCAVESKETASYEHLKNAYDIPLVYINPAMDSTNELDQLDNPAGIVIFGSHSNINEKLDWHKKIIDYTIPKIEKSIPTMGICFGHQLIANAFGAKLGESEVESDDGHQGVRDVQFLRRFFNIKRSEKLSLFVSHKYEVKELPKEFIPLAQSSDCKFDAIAHESLPFIGFQSHPEATKAFVDETIKRPLSDDQILTAESSGRKVMLSFLDMVKQHYSA